MRSMYWEASSLSWWLQHRNFLEEQEVTTQRQ